jgi:hemerythrin-like domain-containing protein
MSAPGAAELTDLLRKEHEVIRSHLRRLERGLALVLAAVERGTPPLGMALEWARGAGAALRLLIPKHVKDEEELLATVAGAAVERPKADAQRLHAEVESEYGDFLLGLGALGHGALEAAPLRELALRLHTLSDLLGRHMRHEEEFLFPSIERALSAEAKGALAARLRRDGNPGPTGTAG